MNSKSNPSRILTGSAAILLRKSRLGIAVASLGVAASAHAQSITWDPAPITMASDAEVLATGAQDRSYIFGSTGTINGVAFTNFQSNLNGDTVGGGMTNYPGAAYAQNGSTFPNYGSLSSAYQQIARYAVYANGGGGTITLNGLNSGIDYTLQLWVNDSRDFGAGTIDVRTETINGSPSLDYNVQNGSGGVGQYVTGTFTGAGTPLTLTVSANQSAQVNALNLRATGVSAGATATITSPKSWQTLTTGAGSTLVFNPSVDGSSFTAISGGASLVKTGATTVVLGGASTYTGTTDITGGTLSISATAGAARRFDASNLGLANGADVTQWNDLSGSGANATVPGGNATPTYIADAGTGTGLGAISLLGSNGASSQALSFSRDTNVRSMFSIFKGSSFLATDSSTYALHRPGDSNAADPLLANFGQINYLGTVRVNGSLVNPQADPMPTGLNNGYNLVELISNGNSFALDSFNKDRGTIHAGNQSQAEVIMFDSVISETQRQQVEAYLQKKWFNQGVGVGNLLPATTAVTISGGGTLDISGENYQTVASLSATDASSTRVTLGTAALTFGDANNKTFDGVISGTGSITKAGIGTQVFTGANTYSGPTTIVNGALEIAGTAGSLGTNTGPIINNGTLRVNRTNAVALGNAIIGIGGVSQVGTGTTTLTGANTYTGPTVVSNGVLQLNGAAPGAIASSSLTISGGAGLGFTAGTASTLGLGASPLSLGGTIAFDIGSVGVNDAITTGTFTLTANSAFTFNPIGAIANGTPYTLITSTNPIVTNGFSIAGQTVGKLTLTPTINANTVTLTPILLQGIWNQTGGGNWSNGNPNATGGNWTNYKPTVAGDAALFGSAITAPANVAVDAPHTVGFIDFNNTNTYTIGSSGSNNLTLGNGASAAVVSVSAGSHIIAENTVLASNSSISAAGGTTLTISGNLSGTGGVQLFGTGTLDLSGSNTHTGGTTVSGGTIRAAGASAFGAAGAAVTVNSGAAINVNGQLLAQQPTISGPGLNANTGAIFTTVDNPSSGFAALTLGANASIGNNGGRFDIGSTPGSTTQGNGFTLTKVGNNTVGIQANAVNLGGVVINGGTLQPENDNAFGNATVTVNSGGSLSPSGGHSFANALVLNNGGAIRAVNGFNDTYSGGVTLGVSGTVDAVNGAITMAGSIGGGSLVKTGNGLLILSGGNTHGATTVNAGTVRTDNNSALGGTGASVVVASGASLDINGRTLQAYVQNFQIAGTGADPSHGALGNSGAESQSAIRGITLTGDASVGGNGGRWDIGRIDFNTDPNNTVDHIEGGGFVLTKVGSGYLGLLTGAANLGGFVMNGGTVAPHENTSFGDGPVTLNAGIIQPWGGLTVANSFTLNGGTIQTDGFNDTYTGPMNVTSSTNINPRPGGNITFANNVTGAGDLVKTGGFSFFLSGDNSGYTGTLSNNQSNTFFGSATAGSAAAKFVVNTGNLAAIATGVLNVELGSLAGTGGNVGNNSAGSAVTYIIGGNNSDTTFSGNIVNSVGGGGTTAITKVGTGELTLSGILSYTDVTTILDGTLNVDSALGAGANVVNANGGETNFRTSQTLSELNIGDGAVVTLTNLPPAAPEFALAGGASVAAVPEPGSATLLLSGALALLGIRRRRNV